MGKIDSWIPKIPRLKNAKVSRFSYKNAAYTNDDIEGVENYDYTRDMNVPTINKTDIENSMLDSGARAQFSSLSKNGLNHFFGRVSYNLNKVIDFLSDFLDDFISFTEIVSFSSSATLANYADGTTKRLLNTAAANVTITLPVGETYLGSNTITLTPSIMLTITKRGTAWVNSSGNAITADKWKTARNITISDADGINTGTAVSVDGSENETLKLPATIKANLTGNASTATKLATSRNIGSALFDGTADITQQDMNVCTQTYTPFMGYGVDRLEVIAGPWGASNDTHANNGSPYQVRLVVKTIESGTGYGQGMYIQELRRGSSTWVDKARITEATKLVTSRNIGSASFDGTADITQQDMNVCTQTYTPFMGYGVDRLEVIAGPWGAANTDHVNNGAPYQVRLVVKTVNPGSGQGQGMYIQELRRGSSTWVDKARITDNSATATKLETSRNINNVAFDGSANIFINNYSTTEQRIGTWIDGKPLYRKVVNFGALPSISSAAVAHGISNLGWCYFYGGGVSVAQHFTLPHVNLEGAQYGIQITVDATNIVISTGTSHLTGTVYVVLEYTKTTD